MTATLHLMCGLPGAGKTTWAKALEVERDAVRFSPDERLADAGKDLRDEAARDALEREMWDKAEVLLAEGRDVILDFGFWSVRERDEARHVGEELGAEVVVWFLDASFEVLVERLRDRIGDGKASSVAVTEEELRSYRRVLEPPLEREKARVPAFTAP